LTTTAENKRFFVAKMEVRQTVCIGNGNIDVEMFKVADEQLRGQEYDRLLPPLVTTV
jgi:hypothetical protein